MTIAYFNKKLSEAINNLKCYVKQRLGSRNYRSLILDIEANPTLSYNVIDDTIDTSWTIELEPTNSCGENGLKIVLPSVDMTKVYVFSSMQSETTLFELYICQIDIIDCILRMSIVSPFEESAYSLDKTFLEIRIYE